MTRTYAALKLLEHGPLTFRQFAEITGWPIPDCRRTLSWLAETGRIERVQRCGWKRT